MTAQPFAILGGNTKRYSGWPLSSAAVALTKVRCHQGSTGSWVAVVRRSGAGHGGTLGAKLLPAQLFGFIGRHSMLQQ